MRKIHSLKYIKEWMNDAIMCSKISVEGFNIHLQWYVNVIADMAKHTVNTMDFYKEYIYGF